MNKPVAPLPLILPIGLLMVLGVSALGFQYFAVHAFDVGTDREFIPKLQSSPTGTKCVKQR
jgi:hypothetical protein